MKKTGLIRCVLFSSILPFFFSCSNEYEINSMQDKLNQTEQKITKLKSSDWDQLSQEMKDFEFFVEQNKQEFSPEEREKANKLIVKYNRILVEKQIKDVESEIKDFSNKIEGLIN
jgi:hypothetical protein